MNGDFNSEGTQPLILFLGVARKDQLALHNRSQRGKISAANGFRDSELGNGILLPAAMLGSSLANKCRPACRTVAGTLFPSAAVLKTLRLGDLTTASHVNAPVQAHAQPIHLLLDVHDEDDVVSDTSWRLEGAKQINRNSNISNDAKIDLFLLTLGRTLCNGVRHTRGNVILADSMVCM